MRNHPGVRKKFTRCWPDCSVRLLPVHPEATVSDNKNITVHANDPRKTARKKILPRPARPQRPLLSRGYMFVLSSCSPTT